MTLTLTLSLNLSLTLILALALTLTLTMTLTLTLPLSYAASGTEDYGTIEDRAASYAQRAVAAPPHAKSLAKLRRALKDRNAARARGEDPFNSERPADVGDVALQLMASAAIPPAFSPNKVHEQLP